jgi:hypothetical protein
MTRKKQIYRDLVTGKKAVQLIDPPDVTKYEHIQEEPQLVLLVNHGRNTNRLIVLVNDLENNPITPNRIELEPDPLNNVTIEFNAPTSSKITIFFL